MLARAKRAAWRSPSSALCARGRIFFTASRLRASPSAWTSARRALPGALSRAFTIARVPCGPPMARRTAVAGPASASSERYLSRGRMDSCLPTSWTCERRKAATVLSCVRARVSSRARANEGPLGLGPGPHDVDGEAVHREARAGVVALPGRQDAGADVRDRPGPQAQELGAQGVLLRGCLRREPREDRRDAPLQVRRGRVGGGESAPDDSARARAAAQMAFIGALQGCARGPAWAGPRGGWPRRRRRRAPSPGRSAAAGRAGPRSSPG